jgi:predicted DNA-binding transcriptional regulator YafY
LSKSAESKGLIHPTAKQKQATSLILHPFEEVAEAIEQGQAIAISRTRDPYHTSSLEIHQVWALQLMHYDQAWYLLYETCDRPHLVIERLDRLSDYCQRLPDQQRSLAVQRQRLQDASTLLDQGWGLYLGNLTEQQAELQKQLKFERVKVRFFPPMTTLILEGKLRHRSQTVIPGAKDPVTGRFEWVDYQVKLPRRSLQEFKWWVCRHMEKAQILAPDDLAEEHLRSAQQLVARYQHSGR